MTASPCSARPPLLLLLLLVGPSVGRATSPEPASDLAGAPDAGETRDSADDVGSILRTRPSQLAFDGPPTPSVDAVREALDADIPERAVYAAERFVAVAEPGRAKDAALLALGTLYAESGRHNLACEAFADVRHGEGPLVGIATHFEAEQEAARGQPARAIERCEEYRTKWPDGTYAADCLRIIAHAYAALDEPEAARAAAERYDAEHPWGGIAEQVELATALRWVEEAPERAIPRLLALAVDYTAPLTGRVAEEQLARLFAAGYSEAQLPTDPASLRRRAISLRDSGRRDAAWAAYEVLPTLGDPETDRFVAREAERFAWSTHRWDYLVDLYRTEDGPDAAWSEYRSLVRAGRFDEAGTLGQQRIGQRGYWRRAEEEVARTLMLARRYDEACALLDRASARGGWSGVRAAHAAAFATYMAGHLDDAVRRFSDILATGESTEARYWRARALVRLERVAEAAVDEGWIVSHDEWSWYATLIRSRSAMDDTLLVRDGRWPGPRPDTAPLLVTPRWTPAYEDLSALAAPPRPVPLARTNAAASLSRWVPRRIGAASDGVPAPTPAAVEGVEHPPRSYVSSPLFDPVEARRALADFADEHGRRWPELLAIADLASVGLYDLSGPMFDAWTDRVRALARRRDRGAKRIVSLPAERWRLLFFAARDHHNSARIALGGWAGLSDPALVREAYRLAYPLAHDRYVWRHAADRGIDPFLVLGLMRQESTYDATARSRVGARGAMQIMPRTGHLLADRTHDLSFDAGDLEDPTVAIGYGMVYLELLMLRFGGAFPLAVASYNAGPFNVSNWMRGTGADMSIDELVEHIPYRETRDYVKKVTAGYAAYVDLYGPPGARLVVPEHPAGDRPDIVDF